MKHHYAPRTMRRASLVDTAKPKRCMPAEGAFSNGPAALGRRCSGEVTPQVPPSSSDPSIPACGFAWAIVPDQRVGAWKL